MKKVLFVFNHPAPYKVALLNGLANHFDLHVIFERDRARDRHELFYSINEENFKFTLHKIKGINFGAENVYSRGIKKHLKANHYDLIIMNGYSTLAEMIGLRYLKKKKIPYLFYINGGIIKKENKLKARVKRYFISGADQYLSPSPAADDYLIHYGVNRANIFHYPYATVYEKDLLTKPCSISDKEKMRRSFGITNARFLFISFGQFIERKNNLRLLEIWRQLPKDICLLLIGDGPLKGQYQEYIAAHNLSNVILHDFMQHVQLLNTLKMGDYAVFLSKEDIYGHVINEALSQGLGVVASDKILSAKTLIEEGKNGFLVNYDNSEDVIDKLKAITKLDPFAAATTSAAHNTVEKMIEVHVDLLKRIL